MRIRLCEWRERRGMSQRKLAEVAVVGVATVRRIEAGQDAYVGTIEKLAKALKVSPSQLVVWDSEQV